jgi:hypothetical protein
MTDNLTKDLARALRREKPSPEENRYVMLQWQNSVRAVALCLRAHDPNFKFREFYLLCDHDNMNDELMY